LFRNVIEQQENPIQNMINSKYSFQNTRIHRLSSGWSYGRPPKGWQTGL